MSFLIAGMFGGLLRGAVGLTKYMTSYKDVEMRPQYFLGSIAVAGIIGYTSAWVARDVANIFLEAETFPVSFAVVIGYAGGDFLENIFKIAVKNPDFFQIKKSIQQITGNEKK